MNFPRKQGTRKTLQLGLDEDHECLGCNRAQGTGAKQTDVMVTNEGDQTFRARQSIGNDAKGELVLTSTSAIRTLPFAHTGSWGAKWLVRKRKTPPEALQLP